MCGMLTRLFLVCNVVFFSNDIYGFPAPVPSTLFTLWLLELPGLGNYWMCRSNLHSAFLYNYEPGVVNLHSIVYFWYNQQRTQWYVDGLAENTSIYVALG